MAVGRFFRNLLSKKGKKLREETARKKRYAEHYKKAGKHALTYAQWLKKGEKQTYFKGAGFRGKSTEAQLRESGIDTRRFN